MTVKDIKEQKYFNLKDIIIVVSFVIGLAGSWFSTQARINTLEEKVNRTEEVLKDNNLELINYKLDALITTVDKLVAKLESE